MTWTSLAQQTDLIKEHGLEVWIAVVLLGAFLIGFAAVGKWFLDQQPKSLKELSDSVEKLRKAVNLLNASQTGMRQQLLTLDLTMRGLNPSVGGELPERDAKALPVYQEASRQMDEMIAELKRMGQ